MNLASLSIKRPTFIMALVIVMLVVGGVSYYKLGVDQFPNVNFPIVVVITTYQGAGPAEVESQVSKPIEEQVSSVAGLRHVSSMNYEGFSVVVAEFSMGGDIKDLEQQTRARVAMAKRAMPDGVEEPIIRRADPSDMPIVIASLSANMEPKVLYSFADRQVRTALEQVDGVSHIEIIGGSRREIQVLLDRAKLDAHQISLTAVVGRLAGSSMNVPVGKVDEGTKELSFRTLGEYRNLDQINNVPVNFIGSDIPVKVSDLGEVVDAAQETVGYAYYNGKASVMLMVYRQSSANTVKVADGVTARITKLNKEISGLASKPKLSAIIDFSKNIRMSLNDVKMTILEGILLAVIVVYLFLGSARSTFITTIALPNSLLGAFILMSIMGFTINMITLMALSLAVGLLIDDAIVVRENIWRHMERGDEPREAAVRGTREVTLAVVATTLTVISVFLPVGFLSGMMGQFFKELGFTIVFAMAISLFDAMTTAPLLSAYLAKKTNGNGRKGNGRNGHSFKGICGRGWWWLCWGPRLAAAATRRFQDILVEKYEIVIRWSLRHRLAVFSLAVSMAITAIILVFTVKLEFVPPSDTGSYQLAIELPPGTSLDKTLATAKEVEQVIRSRKENENIAMMVGGSGFGGASNAAMFYIEMTPSSTRKVTTTDMKQLMRNKLAKRKDFKTTAQDMHMMNMGSNFSFNMALNGDNLMTLMETADRVKAEFAKIKDLVDLDADYRTGVPELQFNLDPEKMAGLGASTVAVGTELRYMVAGTVPARFRDGDDEYDIRVFLKKDQRDLKAAYDQVRVPNNNFNLVRLGDLAEQNPGYGVTKITRRDRTRYINIGGNIGPKGTIGSVQGEAEKAMKKMKLPVGVTYRFWGTAEYFNEMIRDVVIAMILAVIFMYLILASLYESILMPFLIMAALPFAFVGAFIALKVTGQNLTMFAMIGLIMLLGLVAKNSILLVDFAMQMTRRGISRDEAIIRAGKVRLRPILMTTIALIAGMLPLAFALTEVGKIRQSMGITIIGGLISSLLLTLIVIPSMFGWADRFRRWSRRLLGRPEDREIDKAERYARLPVEARTPRTREHTYN